MKKVYKKIHPAIPNNYKIFLKNQIYFDAKNYDNVISQSSRKNYFLISTPFHLKNTSDDIFSQKRYFKNGDFLKEILPYKTDIQLGKTKLIFFFEDWWGFCNQNETDDELSGNLISYDIYNWLYAHLLNHNLLSNSCFVSGVSTVNVSQFHDWPIINYNLAFNCFFSNESMSRLHKNNSNFNNFIFSLNRRARPHRLYTFYKLCKLGLLNESKYSFHFFSENIDSNYSKNQLFKDYMQKWITDIDERILDKLKSNFTDTTYSATQNNYNSISELSNISKSCFLEVITEFNCSNKKVFLTEKTARSIVLKNPFILIGDKNSLLELQALGFKTFSNCWNEEYDSYNTEKERIDHAITTILKIKELYNWKNYYNKDIEDIINYNYDWYFTGYKQTQKELFRKIFD